MHSLSFPNNQHQRRPLETQVEYIKNYEVIETQRKKKNLKELEEAEKNSVKMPDKI